FMSSRYRLVRGKDCWPQPFASQNPPPCDQLIPQLCPARPIPCKCDAHWRNYYSREHNRLSEQNQRYHGKARVVDAVKPQATRQRLNRHVAAPPTGRRGAHMDDARYRREMYLPPRRPEPITQVDVLEIHEGSLIAFTYLFES